MHLVVFDIDGTLARTGELDARLYGQAVEEVLGAPVDPTWKRYRHVTDSGILGEILERAQRVGDAEAGAAIQRRFVALTRTALAEARSELETPGARSLLESLAAHPRACIAIATGGWRETARLKLQAIGVDPDAYPLASGSDAISRTEIMRIAERQALAGNPATARTYFGDADWDRRACAELGWDFIAVGSALDHPARIEDFSDAPGLLRRLGLVE